MLLSLFLLLLLLYVCIKVQAADQQHLLQVWHGDKSMPQQLLQDGSLLHSISNRGMVRAAPDAAQPSMFVCLTSAFSCCTYKDALCL